MGRVFAIACSVIGLLVLNSGHADPIKPQERGKQQVKIARVALANFAKDAHPAFVFREQDEIHKLIMEPIRTAKIDANPARYPVLGTLTLEFEDGTSDSFVLFSRMAHFKHGEKYYVSDFSDLKAKIMTLAKLATKAVED